VTVTTAPERAETVVSEQPDSAPRKSETTWERRYARRLIVTDLLVVVWAVAGAQIARFGLDPTPAIVDTRRYEFELATSYTALSLILIAAWMLVLAVFGTRDSRAVGVGSTEYKRIFDASLRLFGLVAIVAFLLRVDVARSYVLLAFPAGVFALLFARWLWRQWLVAVRGRGAFSSRVLLLGSMASLVSVARDLIRFPGAGYHVVAAIATDDVSSRHLLGTTIPLSSGIDRVMATMAERDADTLVITSSAELSPQRVRELSWSLEPGRQHLVVAPSLTDVGGPRIHMRPVAGLPLMHVETPRYEGAKRVAKRTFDLLASGGLILICAPVMLLIATAVRLSSRGPILFPQERVGLKGRHFRMLKFRSMVIDAEAMLGGLEQQAQDRGNKVLFKMEDDPRVTPVGKVLRRFSLDELPQLLNVFVGDMSLVGPRPPLEREVAIYETHVHRRFLVKPGITGLWQISGRSNLSWEDSVRLDLYYVENWSLTGDLIILWRTLRAVLARDGAY
jgi:exopolysaccharide biosynthesis polyprenyl glycosylphosphotransferase